jgi:acyl-[acyl-carrier-protein] desaturase
MTGAPPEASPLDAHAEVIRALEPAVARELRVLPPPASAWQPTDYLPDFAADGWQDELAALRTAASRLPDDLLVVLVGDMVTEEALPSYAMALNTLVQDETGTSARPWATWLRGWTAEENRHGDLLNAYLRLSGRVDMRAVERSVQTLIAGGFSSDTSADPYNLLVYTAFQERATRVSHRNVAQLAEGAGDVRLGRICRTIAGDEARHEGVYTRLMREVLALDPDGGVRAFATMLRRQITMPGVRMGGAADPPLFDRFAAVAQRAGVYTARDYAAIIGHLVRVWDIGRLAVGGDAAEAQDAVCRAAERAPRIAERLTAAAARLPSGTFDWLAGRAAATTSSDAGRGTGSVHASGGSSSRS